VSGCDAYRDARDQSLGQCGAPATVTAACACVHEHIGEQLFCAPHADALRNIDADGDALCRICSESAEPHECPLALTYRPLAPAVT